MKKFLAGFFLCIFLLNGFGPDYAYAYGGSVSSNLLSSASGIATESGQEIIIKSPSAKENLRMVTEIQENEESSSSKKQPGSNRGFTTIVYLHKPGCLNLPTRKTLSFSAFLFDLCSQRRHLVFGVIRI